MCKNDNIPSHVAIIMDGNGRWARERGMERVEGHIKGVDSVREAIRSAVRHGIGYLTLYVFSKENWGRPASEVDALMELICKCVAEETPELLKQGVRMKIIGERESLPAKVREDMARIEKDTANGGKITVVLALGYSSKSEITEGVRRIAAAASEGKIRPEDVTAQLISDNLYTAGMPDPDLLIRTGGDVRLSNFMLWQAAYAELYFTPEYWPDFGAESFDRAVEAYGRRERRYGLISKNSQ